MKRASYREAIAWIAHNDNAGNGDSEEDVAGYVTVALVSDIFWKGEAEVAAAVMRVRNTRCHICDGLLNRGRCDSCAVTRFFAEAEFGLPPK